VSGYNIYYWLIYIFYSDLSKHINKPALGGWHCREATVAGWCSAGIKVVHPSWAEASLACRSPVAEEAHALRLLPRSPDAPPTARPPTPHAAPAAKSAVVAQWERWIGEDIPDPERFEVVGLHGRVLCVSSAVNSKRHHCLRMVYAL
jgi:hypothetical protein